MVRKKMIEYHKTLCDCLTESSNKNSKSCCHHSFVAIAYNLSSIILNFIMLLHCVIVYLDKVLLSCQLMIDE